MLGVLIGVAVVIFGIILGGWIAQSQNPPSVTPGNNNPDGNCSQLCADLQARHSERCIAEADERNAEARFNSLSDQRNRFLTAAAIATATAFTAFGLQGCNGIPTINAPFVAAVSFTDRSQAPNVFCDGLDKAERARCTPELLESLRYAEIGKTIGVVPTMGGSGYCESVSVDFGDGTPPARRAYFDVNSNVRVPHTYNGWPGKKLVRIKGDGNCGGDVKKEITVGFAPDGHTEYRLGFMPNGQICNAVPNMPSLRRGSMARIKTNGMTIDYGGNKVFDASGDPSSPVPAGYLFPDHRKYSIVYRVGTQLIQGEAGVVIFRVNQTDRLEICVNDNPGYLTDNSGGMRLDIAVNEISAN